MKTRVCITCIGGVGKALEISKGGSIVDGATVL